MSLALSVCTILIVLATVLPLWKNSHWTIRGLDFPRLQLAVLASALLFSQLYFFNFTAWHHWLLASSVLLCLLWQLWWILPYTRLWPYEVLSSENTNPERQLTIITANVLTPNRNADSLIQLVKQHKPDVLVTLESDLWWQQQLDCLETEMPFTIKCPLDNLYGMHVYSRLALTDSEIAYLVEDDVPSMHALLTLKCGNKVRMHFLHPAPPSPTENEQSIERDAELIIVARSIADTPQATIITGDLNDVAWSRTTRLFRKLSGLLDPRVGRGMFNTFHASYPFLRWPLDHLFHSQHFTLNQIQRLPSIGSDHFALMTTLSYTPSHGAEQNGLTPVKEDKELATEITQQQGVNKKSVPEPGK
ncbi:endonuclease/exonuclease/phosphatase family protein [Rheinheimera sp. MMS21-TC3]|uniref:endonuclease/exonuclease/phosphatase family protein n=1 Tax=Rheinheimera sp. MMS21-TC3 TaxID=3072790 RepID=UPI0028C488DC|nr:endonuclease/exonuclease/phosphatase family protein [Rheinheimera sp. MMS21-TC3]WNO59572.1 endonuclease/exonuclease/phosphatase family protein [Rheinheimera sp. MMS21-TC3]